MTHGHEQERIALEHAAVTMGGAMVMLAAPGLTGIALVAIALNHLAWGVRLALDA